MCRSRCGALPTGIQDLHYYFYFGFGVHFWDPGSGPCLFRDPGSAGSGNRDPRSGIRGSRDPGSEGLGSGIRGPSSGSENSAGIRDPEPGSGIRKTSDELVVWLNTIIASLPDQCDVSILETECSTFQCFVEPTNSYIEATICTETPCLNTKSRSGGMNHTVP